MLNLLSRVEIEDYWIEQSAASEGRLNILRRQIAFYRQNLRQTADAEFAAMPVAATLVAGRFTHGGQ